MADAEDDTPKPRTWTQWAQDNWQWLLPLGLVVLAGLVAAILWYYRADAPLTTPPQMTPPQTAPPQTAPLLTAAPNVAVAAAPQTHTIPMASQTPAASPMVPVAAQTAAAPPNTVAAMQSIPVVGAPPMSADAPQAVHSEVLMELLRTPAAQCYTTNGLPHVQTSTGKRYFAANFPPGWQCVS